MEHLRQGLCNNSSGGISLCFAWRRGSPGLRAPEHTSCRRRVLLARAAGKGARVPGGCSQLGTHFGILPAPLSSPSLAASHQSSSVARARWVRLRLFWECVQCLQCSSGLRDTLASCSLAFCFPILRPAHFFPHLLPACLPLLLLLLFLSEPAIFLHNFERARPLRTAGQLPERSRLIRLLCSGTRI